MIFSQVTSIKDPDIPHLLKIHRLPEIRCFIDINERKYFKFVVKTSIDGGLINYIYKP